MRYPESGGEGRREVPDALSGGWRSGGEMRRKRHGYGSIGCRLHIIQKLI